MTDIIHGGVYPRYQSCDGIARALEIADVQARDYGDIRVSFTEPGFETLDFFDERDGSYSPVAGDFLAEVGGKWAFIPRKTFLDSYQRTT